MFRKKKEADEGKKKFPFIPLIAFILTILVFFFFASRVKAIDGEEEESSEGWGYVENTTIGSTPWIEPDPIPIEESESSEEETSEPEETEPEETETEEPTQPEEPTEPEETQPEDSSFVYSDLEYLRRDVSAIKSLLLFTLVGSSAVLLCYMLYRLIRIFM